MTFFLFFFFFLRLLELPAIGFAVLDEELAAPLAEGGACAGFLRGPSTLWEGPEEPLTRPSRLLAESGADRRGSCRQALARSLTKLSRSVRSVPALCRRHP